MQVISKQGQWIGDVAIREAGSIESVVEMAIDNEISITDNMNAETIRQKPDAYNRRVMNYYSINNIHPATSTKLDEKSFRGIGYMSIGSTFKINSNE